MYKEIKKYDKILILMRTSVKLFRGAIIRIFLKSTKGLVLVGKNVKITHGKNISCGKNIKFEDFSEIQGLSQNGLIFGDNVTIGRNVMIRPSSYYGKDLGKGLIMGNNSSIGPDGYIGCSGQIIIGNNVMFGPKCSLFAENHNFSQANINIKEQGVNQKGIIIKDNCWIGSNCIILDGVTIGEGCVIGAGTVITKDIEPYSIVIDKKSKSIVQRKKEFKDEK